MSFEIDERIHASSFWLGDWALSSVYLKNDANFPWAILVPRENAIQEIYQLSEEQRCMLINEVAALSEIIQDVFKPDKLNVGALGNMVSQLHVHVVARFKTDTMWPYGVWQAAAVSVPYTPQKMTEISKKLSQKIGDYGLKL